MKKDNTNMLLLAGAGVLAWFLLKPKTTAPLSTGTPGVTALPYTQAAAANNTTSTIASTGSALAKLLPSLFNSSTPAQPASSDLVATNTTTDSIQAINSPGPDMSAANTNALEAQMYAQYQSGIMSGVTDGYEDYA